ncbi:MAG: V-type ATPase 116kDa subunit family protein [Elusimicrobiota bacterium]|nr:V-type ATPase 116kDa subunit family protein [Elusimicrobiota bacterium]
MSRLEAVLLKKDARSALRGLGGEGAVEIINSAPGPETAPAAPADNSRALAACSALLARLGALRRDLGLAPLAAAGKPGMDYAAAVSALEELESGAAALFKRHKELSAEAAALSRESERLAVYAGLALPPAGAGKFNFLYCAAGSVPAGKLRGLLARLPADTVLVPLAEKEGRRHLAALAGPSSGAALETELKAAGFQEEAPARPGLTLGEAADYFISEKRRAGQALKQAGREIASLAAGAAGPLAPAGRAIETERRLLEAEQALPGTEASLFFSGWAPAEEAARIGRGLGKNSGWRCAVEASPAGAGCEVPVLLKPPRLLRPFAALVKGYGLPRYGEADPTVFAALSFLFMFGMMFGDVGHGAALCLAGAWLSRWRRGKEGAAGRAVFGCGLASIFFGFVYGSFFGFESFRKYALWRDPLAGDPLALLAAAVLTGAAVISLGVLLNIVNRARLGDGLGAALDRYGAAGLAFYWTALLLAAGKAGAGLALPVMGAALACWILKAPLVYLMRPRGGTAAGDDGFISVVVEAIVRAFEGALLYLANTVSFVRLAAYAMCHAALLASAWALRDAADGAWGANSHAGILAVIAGNAAAIGLEGLVAAVQALRLEYYEFFGKFFEGVGRPFRPFTLKGGI